MKLKFFALIFVIFLIFVLGLVSFLKPAVYEIKLKNNIDFSYAKNFYSINTNKIRLKPIICEPRVWEVNLSKNQIYFFENCKLKKIIPIAYQSPENVWYKTPTSYYRIGIKKEKHISSIFPVYMNYSVQMYEDFFIHEIPYYLDGTPVSSRFTGGCIRLEPKYAKEFFNLAKTGDLVISYKDLDDFEVDKNFVFPVNKDQFFIRQRFNSPLRTSWTNSQDRRIDYSQHTAIDLAPLPDAKDLNVYNIYDGKVAKIVINGKNDHGLGNTVIVEHLIDQKYIYSLYAHLESINPNLFEGKFIRKGEIIGKVGATGYGCNYWRIGEDGCDKKTLLDTHLHFEIKTKPVLESPVDIICNYGGKIVKCYGYTPDDPRKYGYLDPLEFLRKK